MGGWSGNKGSAFSVVVVVGDESFGDGLGIGLEEAECDGVGRGDDV